jgi:hypothetical protein
MLPQEQIRQAAADCLDIAQTTTDPTAKIRLTTLAQNFMELAEEGLSSSHAVLARLLEEFNDAQMLKH